MLNTLKFNRSVVALGLGIVFMGGLSSCSNETPTSPPQAAKESAPQIAPKGEDVSQSFAQVPNMAAKRAGHPNAQIFPQDQELVAIKQSALGKEFLLSASIIPQQGAPTSSGLQGRVVEFRQVANRIVMIQSNVGQVMTRQMPATSILAEFPIKNMIREGDDILLVIDFNLGMSKIFVAGNWWASDIDGKDHMGDAANEAIPIKQSFLKSVELKGGYLEIRQVAQIESNKSSGSSLPMMMGQPLTLSEKKTYSSFEARYFISPYAPTPGFETRETTDFTSAGFFEVNPQIEQISGRENVLISRWDHRKPVTYHLSSNTPHEYAQAIKEGVLYWNNAFGKEVVRVEVAPQGVTAPDPRYNVIQWVENDSAGSAYADGLMDPRTGEILHAQVYLTSAFGEIAIARTGKFQRRAKTEEPQNGAKTGVQIGTTILKNGRLCAHDFGAQVRAGIVALKEATGTASLTEAQTLKVARDYLRYVTAHEVGHTLGLRHNFAGNLASNIKFVDRPAVFASYFKNGAQPALAPEQIVTSSVMEYTDFIDSILTGEKIKLASTAAFPYDANAIQLAYDGKAIDTSASSPPFCTDSHVIRGKYQDCNQKDAGSSAVEYLTQSISDSIELLPTSIVETFLTAKAPQDRRDTKAFAKVAIDPSELVKPISKLLLQRMSWLGAQPPAFLKIERQFDYVNSLNTSEVQEATTAWISAQLGDLGVKKAALVGLPVSAEEKPIGKSLSDKLDALLAREDFIRGIGEKGEAYELSAAEIEMIRSVGKKVIKKAESGILEAALSSLVMGGLTNDAQSAEYADGILSAAKNLILAVEGGAVPAQFYYSQTLRTKAMTILQGVYAPEKPGAIDWSKAKKAEIANELTAIVEAAFPGTKYADIKAEDIKDAALKKWFLQQKALISGLAPADARAAKPAPMPSFIPFL